jgi:hypothetical protein
VKIDLFCIRESGKAITALIIACIVDEMMNSDDVVISNYISQVLLMVNINHFRLLIDSESRTNFAELKLTSLNILAVW